MRFQHQAEIDRTPNCPSEGTRPPKEGEIAWRLVFSPLQDARNFRPMCDEDPQRYFGASSKGENLCVYYAISLFDTKESLQERMRSLQKRHLDKKGDHIAIGTLKPHHGVRTESQRHHFSLWIAENVDLRSAFSMEGPLK